MTQLHEQLNWYPHQAFWTRRVVRLPAKFKKKMTYQRMDKPSCRVNGHLAQTDRLGSIAMYASSAVVTQQDSSDWKQQPSWRVPLMGSVPMYPWPMLVFKLEDICYGLSWRQIGPTQCTCTWHATYEWIHLWLPTLIWKRNWSSTQLCNDIMISPSHGWLMMIISSAKTNNAHILSVRKKTRISLKN